MDSIRRGHDLNESQRIDLDDIIHSLRSGFYVADNNGNISIANRAFADMFCFGDEKEVLGVNLADQLYDRGDDRVAFLKRLDEQGFVFDYKIKMVRRDGSRVIVVAQSNLLKNKKGKVLGVEGLLKEIPQEEEKQNNALPRSGEIAALEEKNYQEFDLLISDSLTGLYNYQYFTRCLGAEVKRADRFSQPLCLMMINIDDFEAFNSHYGPEQGDALLKTAGAVLRENLRDTDILCRQSQDQFVVALPTTKRDEILSLAKKIKDAVQKTAFPKPVTCSMGLSRYIPGMTTQELLLKANLGLYMAKENGKNEACLYG